MSICYLSYIFYHNPIFFIELKDPTTKDGKTIFNSEVLLRELERSQRLDVQYFGLCNFVALSLMDSKKLYEKAAVNDGFFTVEEIRRLGQQEQFEVTKLVEGKLKKIADFYINKALEIVDKKSFTAAPPDEIFIFKIRKLIDLYAYQVTEAVFELYENDNEINQKITEYCLQQQWSKPTTYSEIENITHIALLMLIAKIIFYKAYQSSQAWGNLRKFEVSETVEQPEELKRWIWLHLAEFKQITNDFELLIGEETDILYQLPFVSQNTIELVKEIGSTTKDYDFSQIPYDIIGRIFEELIREEERHKLGQYFTPPDVIDLINAYCLPTGKEKVLDPSCGSGTFLVRAYNRKRELTKQAHNFLLEQIYGIDISGYATYLAMLNLSVRNRNFKSYPSILHKDFFYLHPEKKEELFDQQGNKAKRKLPVFDAIVGNPPYIRQEDIDAFNSKAKGNITNVVSKYWNFSPSLRTSIYVYFFYHAAVFLKENGMLGFIVSNSWLNSEFGLEMQQWLLKNFEIEAIIESNIEKFFPSADVNTNIVILRKKEKPNPKHNATFILLYQPLNKIIEEYKSVDNLVLHFKSATKDVTNQSFKLNKVTQEELSISNNWALYAKMPLIYERIVLNNRQKFTALQKIATVKYGNKTGANEFFLLQDKTDMIENKHLAAIVNNFSNIKSKELLNNYHLRVVENGYNELWLIDSTCLKKCLSSPKNVKKYNLRDVKNINNYVLYVPYEKKILEKEFPHTNLYISYGENNSIHNRPTCRSRDMWYFVSAALEPQISFASVIHDVGKFYLNDNITRQNSIKL